MLSGGRSANAVDRAGADAEAVELNSKLPVHLSGDDVAENPKLAALLRTLAGEYIGERGVSRDLDDSLQRARTKMNRERVEYVRNEIVYGELQDFFMKHTAAKDPSSQRNFLHDPPVRRGVESDDHLIELADRALTVAEATQCLSLTATASAESGSGRGVGADSRGEETSRSENVLGLSARALKSAHRGVDLRDDGQIADLQQLLIPPLEARLKEKCDKLMACYHARPSGSGGGEDEDEEEDAGASASRSPGSLLSWARSAGVPDVSGHFGSGALSGGLMRSSQLPAAVQADRRLLQTSKAELAAERAARRQQFWASYTVLVKSVLVLEELLRKHKLEVQGTLDVARVKRMAAMARATVLKLRVLFKQLLLETYTTDNIGALKVVRGHLEAAIGSCRSECAQLATSLQSYRAVGGEFDEIAREYAEVCAELDDKRWTLTTLRQDLDHGDDGNLF